MKHSLELFEQPIPVLRRPRPEDASRLTALPQQAGQETAGALLADLAEFDRFRETSVVAELDGTLSGAVLAYVLPYDPETLFIWQVDVAAGEENKGLASLMLGQLMRRQACAGVTRVQTTISADNDRAWSLFRRFARWQRTRLDIQPFITQAVIPRHRHQNDNIVTIRLQGAPAQAA